jgi:hypothetical protein
VQPFPDSPHLNLGAHPLPNPEEQN